MADKQVSPLIDYRTDGIRDVCDPLTGRVPVEQPGTDARYLRFVLDPAKAYYVVTVVGDTTKAHAPFTGISSLEQTQYRDQGGWLDYYVKEFPSALP